MAGALSFHLISFSPISSPVQSLSLSLVPYPVSVSHLLFPTYYSSLFPLSLLLFLAGPSITVAAASTDDDDMMQGELSCASIHHVPRPPFSKPKSHTISPSSYPLIHLRTYFLTLTHTYSFDARSDARTPVVQRSNQSTHVPTPAGVCNHHPSRTRMRVTEPTTKCTCSCTALPCQCLSACHQKKRERGRGSNSFILHPSKRHPSPFDVAVALGGE